MNNKSYLVLVSGGIDSSVGLHWAHKRFNIEAIVFNYGLPANKMEINNAKNMCQKLNVKMNVLSLTHLDNDMPDNTPPLGSLIMHSLSIYYSLGARINGHIYSLHQWDSMGHPEDPSCSQYSRNYLDNLEELVSTALGVDYSILSPFLDMGKGSIILLGKRLGVDFSNTWSCSSPHDDVHCGTCSACVERKVAFLRARIEDPTEYASSTQYNIGDLFQRKISYYDPKTDSIVSANIT